MNPKRLILYKNEAFRPIASEGTVKNGGLSPNTISWDFVWVNQDIVVNVSTHFQPVINLVRVKAAFCLIVMDYFPLKRTHRHIWAKHPFSIQSKISWTRCTKVQQQMSIQFIWNHVMKSLNLSYAKSNQWNENRIA